MSDEPAVEELGQISDVTVGLAITDRPWELPVDALVVSVGEGGRVGSLGRAVRAAVSPADRSLPLDIPHLTPSTTHAASIMAGSLRSKVLVAVTVHDDTGTGRVATTANVTTAVRVALGRCVGERLGAVALPLLGTGSLGFSVEEVARLTTIAVVRAVLSGTTPPRIVLVDREPARRAALHAAWVEAVGDANLRRRHPSPAA